MDEALLQNLLKSLHDAVTSNRRNDDVALPIFDPEKADNGAESWCRSIEKLGEELHWSSIQQAAKAGKALRGTALLWFESWEPEFGRSWENFRKDIVDLFPEKKNLSEKLTKAVLYTSDTANSYSDYAREKLRLLRNTKIFFTELQLIELVCGGVTDSHIRMACLNSSISSTSELIALLSGYVKQSRKRPFEPAKQSLTYQFGGPSSTSNFKRSKIDPDLRCYTCGQPGHLRMHCPNIHIPVLPTKAKPIENLTSNNQLNKPLSCSFCKKLGHDVEKCYFKRAQRNDSSKPNGNTNEKC